LDASISRSGAAPIPSSAASGKGTNERHRRRRVFRYRLRCTKWLLDAGEEIKLVYTHPDKPEEQRWWASVADLAKERGVPVALVENLDDPAEETRIRAAAPDFFLSFYFRTMVPGRILSIPTQGALNMHGSLLPHFRGRSPINWAILKGATETGASLHYMTEKPDAGDLVDQERVPIGPDDDALAVARRVGDAALKVFSRDVARPQGRQGLRRPLNLAAGSYFGGRTPEDASSTGLVREGDSRSRARADAALAWSAHGHLRQARDDLADAPFSLRRPRRFPGKVEMTENSVIVYGGDDKPVEVLLARPEGARTSTLPASAIGCCGSPDPAFTAERKNFAMRVLILGVNASSGTPSPGAS